MHRTQIYITDTERDALAELSRHTGLSLSQLIRDAIDRYVDDSRGRHRLKLLREAKGCWAGRKDLPDFGALRRELDREVS
ncbi:MAG: CopG family transcriptional regulator [bacterium]